MRIYSVIAIILTLSFMFTPGITKAEETSGDGDVKKLIIPLRITAIISTTATAVIWSKYYVTHRDYMDATEPGKIPAYYDDANKYYKLRNSFIIATGILWAANIATLFINPPPEEVDEFAPYGNWQIHHDIGNRLSLNWNIRF